MAGRQRQMRRVLGLGLAVIAVTATGRSLEAQAAPGLEVLALPDGLAMLCRAVPMDSIGSGAARGLIGREFRFGTPRSMSQPPGLTNAPSRTVAVAFDSGGRPVLLGDKVVSPMSGTAQVIAGRGPDGELRGRYIVVTVDSARVARALAAGRLEDVRAAVQPPESRDLTMDETARVSALASWLWTRRCHGG